MGNKSFFKKILYFLGIDDDLSEEKVEEFNVSNSKGEKGRIINIHQIPKNKMMVFKPMSFEDVEEIADELKSKRAAIVNLESIDKENAKRIIDFLSGSVYALDGSVKKVGSGTFVFTPSNIDISGMDIENTMKENEGELLPFNKKK
ncbi:cell division protein SepF [Thermovenabulum gondwanense]|uniref:Cell division protein SepF n=1 Tax=Thermovenabulum gondwanense TaxID=520767 RepID=A0A162MMQ1_9FIRM|nr:cell division protein SepF [Thermovenabulum gondwanense]KYO66731.1 Cell division protein SepF [Thermovenabulum gondwanense]